VFRSYIPDVGTSHSQTDNQTPCFDLGPTDGQTPSLAQSYRQANSLVDQTPCSKRRQYLYTTVRDLTACTATQTLANQCPQLQLRLQLARTQPSGNGIKCGPPAGSSISQHQQIRPISTTNASIICCQQIATAVTTVLGQQQ
jgi:hypothetical protein